MEQAIELIKQIDWAKEWLGLLASFILVLSFTFKDIKKFRIINSVAALFWILFGIEINSVSVIVTNTFIIGFNIKHLYYDLKSNKCTS